MSEQPSHQDAQEASDHRTAFRLLLAHAGWPTPPAAWAHLFLATAALSELHEPSAATPNGRMGAAAGRLMIRLLDQAFWELRDHRPLRALLPLVRDRSPTINAAIMTAASRLLDQNHLEGPDGAVQLLRVIREDETSRMLRGLTRGIGEDAAGEDRPDLAGELRNPYTLATTLEGMRDRILLRTAELIRTGDPSLRLMDRLAVLVPLAEAAAELRGTRGAAPAELRVRLTDQTLMSLLELLGPDLTERPVPKPHRGDQNARRKAPAKREKAVAEVHNPYRFLQSLGYRSRPLGESLTRIRDHVRSVLAGEIVPMGRRRLPHPADPEALAQTLRRIQAGA
jgi:hypothetical protein